MHTEIDPYIEQYIEDGQKRGFYLRSFLVKRIDYIYFVDDLGYREGTRVIGVIGKDMRGFYMVEDLLENPTKLRTTIYHEIGHIIKKSSYHSCVYCYDIMSEICPIDLTPYEDDKFWSEQLDNYFKWLNEK